MQTILAHLLSALPHIHFFIHPLKDLYEGKDISVDYKEIYVLEAQVLSSQFYHSYISIQVREHYH